LEELGKEAAGEEILIKERQVVLLGSGQLGIEMAGLGLHNREVRFADQECQVNIQNGSAVTAWAQQ